MSYIDDYFVAKNIQFYERDGIMQEDKWLKSNSKILFILKETAGYQKSVFNLVDEIPYWIKDNVPTYIKLAKLTLLLEKSINEKVFFTEKDISLIDFSKKDLLEYIEYSAIINLNKQSVIKKSNDNLLYQIYCRDTSLLKHQITDIEPKIVIGCSNISWKCISNRSNGLYSNVVNNPVKKHTGIRLNNRIFYYTNHPSAWTSGGFDIKKIYQSIMNLYMNT